MKTAATFMVLLMCAGLAFALKPFLKQGRHSGEITLTQRPIEPLSPVLYPEPGQAVVGPAYRKARARRLTRRGAKYPLEIIARYYKALDAYSQSKRDPLIKNYMPDADDLQIMDVFFAAQHDCDNPYGTNKTADRNHLRRWNSVRGANKYSYDKDYRRCNRPESYYRKALEAATARRTKVEVFDCNWERISRRDGVALDMVYMYNYRPNAAYLCAVSLTSKSGAIIETAGYFAKMGKDGTGSWIYMGGFDDVNIELRRVRLYKDIMDNPELAARTRWDAMPN